MMRMAAASVLATLLAAPAAAQPADPVEDARTIGPAAGIDVNYSSDADDTEVLRAGLNLDLRYDGPEHYYGVRLEKVRFNPVGRGWQGDERVYVRGADQVGDWKWNAQVGTDGDTVLGSAAIHDEAKVRKEFFVERDILETPQGLKRGIYYTFIGAAVDLPSDENNVLTLVGGVQPFTGDNVRTHVRATFVHVWDSDIGLSTQLRTRYFHNSVPREYDYYSPRWYAQLLPVTQLRRFSGGWMYLLAGGVGIQRDSVSKWRRSTYVNARFTSPARNNWAVTGGLLFSETPTVTGGSYNYIQANLGLTRRF